MWNQASDKMFLELREDAVFIFEQQSMELLYFNPIAASLIENIAISDRFSTIFNHPAISHLVETTTHSGRLSAITLNEAPWFTGTAVLHCVMTEWDGRSAVVLTIDCRAYGAPPEALQMMKAVLSSAYFTALRVDLERMRVSVINDKNVIMNTQAAFGDYASFISLYANVMIHPEDRAQFLAALSVEQLRLFLEANTSPSCTVRRITEEEYRWASFTLAPVNTNVVLILGLDSNEQHLQQERSTRYQSELKSLSLRNEYILSSVTDIFRMMLHIDLRTLTVIPCIIQDDYRPYLAYDETYQYHQIYELLIERVHPDDRHKLSHFSDPASLIEIINGVEHKIEVDYRRITKNSNPDETAKWTRSTFILTKFENGIPVEAVYSIQDIDAQKRAELLAKEREKTLASHFFTLIRNRFLWYTDSNFSTKTTLCYHITNQQILQPTVHSFDRFFEELIMPNCHPEDYKTVASKLLPKSAEDTFKRGEKQSVVVFRARTPEGWRHVQATLYLQTDENGVLHAMAYIADVDDEIRNSDAIAKLEHEQLQLRQKFGMMIEDSFLTVGEVDLDSDTLCHFHTVNNMLVPVMEDLPFSEYVSLYPERHVHPKQQDEFQKYFHYDTIRKKIREHEVLIKHPFLIDREQNGQYLWCNVGVRFFRDENGRARLMTFLEDINNEVLTRDAQLHELKEVRDQLKTTIRNSERARIRKAHVFLNIASNFQLALNQIYATLDKLEHTLPEGSAQHDIFRSMFTSYERLSAMTECAKDVLLLENNQLPLLNEPIRLTEFFQEVRGNAAVALQEKNLMLYSFTTHVMNETIYSDHARLLFLIQNIFVNIIRSLPDHSELIFMLSQFPVKDNNKYGMYELSLMTAGDSVSQDIQSGLLSPIPKHDPLHAIETEFLMNHPKSEQHSVYLSKRLIARMGGKLNFVRLPNHATAVTLQIPFTFAPDKTMFPLRHTFRKTALVCDPKKVVAAGTMELLREMGMHLEWQAGYENIVAYLKSAQMQGKHFDLVVLRQSEIDRHGTAALELVLSLVPDSAVLIINDSRTAPYQYPNVYYLIPPVFRSTLAEQLWNIFDPKNAPKQ